MCRRSRASNPPKAPSSPLWEISTTSNPGTCRISQSRTSPSARRGPHDPARPERCEQDFVGAEVQRSRRTHFGHYEVVMRAARGHGVISSFFTYTGPYFGDPHEEIDFEFLGRDPTKVWLNRFYDGEKLPGQWIELGFDASEAPHLY